jgi:ankyrin repeat protein
LLWYAAKKGDLEATKLLLARDNIEVNSKDDERGHSLLLCAAKNGHLEVTKLLLA